MLPSKKLVVKAWERNRKRPVARARRTAIGFRKPSIPTISVGPSVRGNERPYKVLLEKEAVYEKPFYLV